MTDAELLIELEQHKAFIIHCSRPGKANEGINGLLFPKDLRKAIDICANQSKELCCSVVWPGHTAAFGDVGIILKPRSTASVTSICTTDGGTWLDPNTGKRTGCGDPFSDKAVTNTFANATGYNEWNVQNADTVGIFVNLAGQSPQVAGVVDVMSHPAYDPAMGDVAPQVFPINITLKEIVETFSDLPIYAFLGTEIIQIGVDASHLYR